MATREEIAIAGQALQIITNAQRDLRRNAQAYLDEISAGHPRLTTAQLGAIVQADGAAIGRLMTMVTTYFADAAKRTKAVNGLVFYGITQAQIVADRNATKAAADAQVVAPVSTDAEIIAAANATLAATPTLDLLF